MTDTIKLTIVSDVVCPWCVIGYKRLEQAIFEMGIQDKVHIEWEPFELNSNMPPEGEDLHEHVAKKYAMTPEDSANFQTTMTSLGAELGFTFDYFDGMKVVNTRNAHVLLEYAHEHDKQTELKLRLFKAFFSDRQDVSDQQILIEAVHGIGLDDDEARARITDPKTHKRLQDREAYWQKQGVMSVPTMIFNGKTAINGAQPIEVYKQILTDLLKNKHVKVLHHVSL